MMGLVAFYDEEEAEERTYRHTSEKTAICKPGKRVSPELDNYVSLISDFQKINFYYLSHPFCGILSVQSGLV